MVFIVERHHIWCSPVRNSCPNFSKAYLRGHIMPSSFNISEIFFALNPDAYKRYNERQKPMKESHARRKKRQPIPERVSGDGSAPPRFRFGFPRCSCCRFAACAWLRRAQRAALVYAKHTPWCQTVKISEFIIVLPIIFLDRISSI